MKRKVQKTSQDKLLKLNVLYYTTIQGNKPYNEDVFGMSPYYCWLLDGATDIFNENPFNRDNSVQWYMHNLNKFIDESRLHYAYNRLSFPFILHHAVKQLYSKLPNTLLPNYAMPTYTVASVQAGRDNISAYILGDSFIYHLHNDKVAVYTDTRLQEYKVSLGHKPYEVLPLEEQRRIRSCANQEGTFAIGTVDGKFLHSGKNYVIPVQHGDRLIIASDGFTSDLSMDMFQEETIKTYVSEHHNSDDCSVILLGV